ncbi:MAG: DNA mismatch repair protein MutS [Methylobacteriaceae bacterium]|jgi:DNA mismatch repair protein MutS|nr:DNA mismatch repair protein MutS [Methylobacteriaceae bacterium]
MMAQYLAIKDAHRDCLLFYRMGDFYEMFFQDAEIASRTLGIVLTKRGKHLGEDIPMCGVPVERADDYLQRLIAAGHRVAVCEQTEDPVEARKRGNKSVVTRSVIRLVTPGTLTEEQLLEPGRANLFLAVARVRNSDRGCRYGLAAVDISTGRFLVSETDDSGLSAAISRLDPNEIVIDDTLRDAPEHRQLWQETRAPVTALPRDGLDFNSAERRLKEYFAVAGLEAFGSFSRVEITAAGTALAYIEKTQIDQRPALSPPVREEEGTRLRIDSATRANLELLRTLSGERVGSLLWAVDRTLTPGGARLVAERLSGPLTSVAAIEERLESVSFFFGNSILRDKIRALLTQTPDILRSLSRIGLGRGGPRDLAALCNGLRILTHLNFVLAPEPDLPAELAGALRRIAAVDTGLIDSLTNVLNDELHLLKRDGGFVRAGFSAPLDEARLLQQDSRRFIAGLQGRYAENTGHRTLRIKHNNMLGFFVEVPQAAGELLVREPWSRTFVHRQTMAGAMRFSTVELSELEAKIASSAERALGIELGIFEDLVDEITAVSDTLAAAADALAVIDVSAAFADLAADLDWRCPQVDDSLAFDVIGARHPVVEAALKARGEPFIANDCSLSGSDAGCILLITGPNMGGKSTYLRQNALIAVLAQTGSFVPAREARIGVVDRLFSRVGAADDLARGRSTFMVEMVETAVILNQATARSLVVLDEIGRGTATFDGLSIAWASIEHLHDVNRCRALFATHFHELTALADRLPRLHNATLKVSEWKGEVVFLHEVVPGAADRSYGLQVARLAGLPRSVTARAKTILNELERADREHPKTALIDDLPLFSAALIQPPAAVQPRKDPLREAFQAVNPDDLSPREALDVLYRLKRDYPEE